MLATHLETEYLINPLGIDITSPRLSWNDERGIKQTGFRITYSLNGESKKTIEVKSSSMHYLLSIPLTSRDKVTWLVSICDEKGNWGPNSEEASFEMGLLLASEWKANWITGNYLPSKKKDIQSTTLRRALCALRK